IRQDCYGLAVGTGARCEKATVTDEILLAHLCGELRIGAYSTNPENACLWGAVDIDSEGHEKTPLTLAEQHHLEALAYPAVTRARALGLEAYLERSRRGGWHVWLFAAEPIPAATMRRVLRFLLADCGFPFPPDRKSAGPYGTVELFPAQDELEE